MRQPPIDPTTGLPVVAADQFIQDAQDFADGGLVEAEKTLSGLEESRLRGEQRGRDAVHGAVLSLLSPEATAALGESLDDVAPVDAASSPTSGSAPAAARPGSGGWAPTLPAQTLRSMVASGQQARVTTPSPPSAPSTLKGLDVAPIPSWAQLGVNGQLGDGSGSDAPPPPLAHVTRTREQVVSAVPPVAKGDEADFEATLVGQPRAFQPAAPSSAAAAQSPSEALIFSAANPSASGTLATAAQLKAMLVTAASRGLSPTHQEFRPGRSLVAAAHSAQPNRASRHLQSSPLGSAQPREEGSPRAAVAGVVSLDFGELLDGANPGVASSLLQALSFTDGGRHDALPPQPAQPSIPLPSSGRSVMSRPKIVTLSPAQRRADAPTTMVQQLLRYQDEIRSTSKAPAHEASRSSDRPKSAGLDGRFSQRGVAGSSAGPVSNHAFTVKESETDDYLTGQLATHDLAHSASVAAPLTRDFFPPISARSSASTPIQVPAPTQPSQKLPTLSGGVVARLTSDASRRAASSNHVGETAAQANMNWRLQMRKLTPDATGVVRELDAGRIPAHVRAGGRSPMGRSPSALGISGDANSRAGSVAPGGSASARRGARPQSQVSVGGGALRPHSATAGALTRSQLSSAPTDARSAVPQQHSRAAREAVALQIGRDELSAAMQLAQHQNGLRDGKDTWGVKPLPHNPASVDGTEGVAVSGVRRQTSAQPRDYSFISRVPQSFLYTASYRESFPELVAKRGTSSVVGPAGGYPRRPQSAGSDQVRRIPRAKPGSKTPEPGATSPSMPRSGSRGPLTAGELDSSRDGTAFVRGGSTPSEASKTMRLLVEQVDDLGHSLQTVQQTLQSAPAPSSEGASGLVDDALSHQKSSTVVRPSSTSGAASDPRSQLAALDQIIAAEAATLTSEERAAAASGSHTQAGGPVAAPAGYRPAESRKTLLGAALSVADSSSLIGQGLPTLTVRLDQSAPTPAVINANVIAARTASDLAATQVDSASEALNVKLASRLQDAEQAAFYAIERLGGAEARLEDAESKLLRLTAQEADERERNAVIAARLADAERVAAESATAQAALATVADYAVGQLKTTRMSAEALVLDAVRQKDVAEANAAAAQQLAKAAQDALGRLVKEREESASGISASLPQSPFVAAPASGSGNARVAAASSGGSSVAAKATTRPDGEGSEGSVDSVSSWRPLLTYQVPGPGNARATVVAGEGDGGSVASAPAESTEEDVSLPLRSRPQARPSTSPSGKFIVVKVSEAVVFRSPDLREQRELKSVFKKGDRQNNYRIQDGGDYKPTHEELKADSVNWQIAQNIMEAARDCGLTKDLINKAIELAKKKGGISNATTDGGESYTQDFKDRGLGLKPEELRNIKRFSKMVQELNARSGIFSGNQALGEDGRKIQQYGLRTAFTSQASMDIVNEQYDTFSELDSSDRAVAGPRSGSGSVAGSVSGSGSVVRAPQAAGKRVRFAPQTPDDAPTSSSVDLPRQGAAVLQRAAVPSRASDDEGSVLSSGSHTSRLSGASSTSSRLSGGSGRGLR